MEQCKADLYIFRLRKDGETIRSLCVHVDDIIVGESEGRDALYASLLHDFQSTQGNLSWYLSCAFERDKTGGVLLMLQRVFIEHVASRYGVNTVSGLPAFQSEDLGPRREGEPVCDKPVRVAVGSLIWVGGMTRPDIANAVRGVARQAHDPAKRHGRAVPKIISYLWGLSLFNEWFPNEDATSASRSLQEGSTKPPWGWVKSSRSLREAFSKSSWSLRSPRILRDGAIASPLREGFMKPL